MPTSADSRPTQAAHIIHTGCKINWYLRIGPRRADGYHDLETLFIPLDEPHDELRIILMTGNGPTEFEGASAASGLRVLCSQAGIDPTHNTLTTAYDLWYKAVGTAPPLELSLIKGVPHGAGLGGGSADAARLLLFLQQWAEKSGHSPLAPQALNALAAKVGADVPFFLLNKPALACGIGEHLLPTANPLAGKHLVLVCPGIEVSTAWAFKALDANREENRKSSVKNLTSDGPRDNTSFAYGGNHENDLEQVVFSAFPELRHIRDELLKKKAQVARMSGSGSSIFGVFSEKERAQAAAAALPYRAYVASFAGA